MNTTRRQELEGYGRFLDEQITWLEKQIHREGVNRRVLASEINAAFLLTDNKRLSLIAPDAVKLFLSDQRWPELDDLAYQNLQYRAVAARDAVATALGLNPSVPFVQRQAIERLIPANFDQFAVWAFIDSWKKGGEVMLAHMSNWRSVGAT